MKIDNIKLLGGPEGPPTFFEVHDEGKKCHFEPKTKQQTAHFLQMHFLKIQFFPFWGKGPLDPKVFEATQRGLTQKFSLAPPQEPLEP